MSQITAKKLRKVWVYQKLVFPPFPAYCNSVAFRIPICYCFIFLDHCQTEYFPNEDLVFIPGGNYLLKVYNGNTRAKY